MAYATTDMAAATVQKAVLWPNLSTTAPIAGAATIITIWGMDAMKPISISVPPHFRYA
eukprot:CAMPEP_0173186746 /NCGR_PEP_ID=MMETSP1141-20130122/10313_1 /TAXON_ID=483371 /ORGANISM="non described non described, Strain CCMP2298" /LENGTH=57 /DNA_ID=CAMNT_0014110483 /DNA_START=618 /DNA_END=791 /DNA_ORIENTATION=+